MYGAQMYGAQMYGAQRYEEPPMKFGFAIPAYGPWLDRDAMVALIEAGEELGYDSIWLPDHIAIPEYGKDYLLQPPFLEPLAACGWGMGLTRRIRFGVDVLVAPYRHPLQVAAMAGTWAHLEPGRFVLGVGIGYLRGEFEVLDTAPYEERAAVTEEFLRVMRDTPEGFILMPSASVPLWVGGNSTKAQRRAGLLGDGWHPLWMPADDYARARELILHTRAEAGLPPEFTFSYSCGATSVLDRDPGDWPAPRGGLRSGPSSPTLRPKWWTPTTAPASSAPRRSSSRTSASWPGRESTM